MTMIFLKQSATVHLANLYEHLFHGSIVNFFHKNGLFSYLDYSVISHTFADGGVVYFDIETYTERAASAAKKVLALDVPTDQETVLIAVTQMIAEMERPYGSRGYKEIKQALEELHEKPWQDIDNVELIDTKRFRRKTGPFFIAKGKPLPARELTVNILLDPTFANAHRELLPLFRQLTWLVMSNCRLGLAALYGCCHSGSETRSTRQTVRLSDLYKVPHGSNVGVADVISTCWNTVVELQKQGAFRQLASELRQLSSNRHTTPGVEEIYKYTRIFIGAKGWQKIATEENCKLLLQHMSIETKYGRERVKRSIGS